MLHDELTLSILRNTEKLKSQKSLADDLGYSVGKINYILKSLIDKGFIKIDNFAKNPNKRNYKYLLTKDGLEEKINLTEKFVHRKKKEYDILKSELDDMKNAKQEYAL